MSYRPPRMIKHPITCMTILKSNLDLCSDSELKFIEDLSKKSTGELLLLENTLHRFLLNLAHEIAFKACLKKIP